MYYEIDSFILKPLKFRRSVFSKYVNNINIAPFYSIQLMKSIYKSVCKLVTTKVTSGFSFICQVCQKYSKL